MPSSLGFRTAARHLGDEKWRANQTPRDWHQIKLLILMARSYDQDVLCGDALLVLFSPSSA